MRRFIAHLLILSVLATNVAWAMDDCSSQYSNNEVSGMVLASGLAGDLSSDSQNDDVCDELCVGWLHLVAITPGTKLEIVDVKGTLKALDNKEQDYSVELGTEIITEMKLELVCDEARVEEATQLVQQHTRTGQADAGWIYVIDICQTIRIEGE